MVHTEKAVVLSMPDPTIIALHFRRVGDSLMATPALRQVRTLRPDARIVVLVEQGVSRVFEGNPAVSEILVVKPLSEGLEFLRTLKHVRRIRPQITMDFLSDPRSAILCRMSGASVRIGIGYRGRRWAFTHCVPCQNPERPIYSAQHKMQLAEPFGSVAPGNSAIEFFLNPADDESASRLWEENGWTQETHVIALGIHSRREYKRWPTERFAEIAQKLIHECRASIAVLVGPGEESSARQGLELINDSHAHMIQPDGLGSLAACLKRCRLFIGNDGGPKHLAVAVGTLTLTLFGDEPFQFWTPPNNPSHVALGGKGEGTNGLLSLTANQVFESARSLLEMRH
jgi:ADP-heptose:LPS heptosyltransferase